MSESFPQQFGKYELIQRIATGGMAEIFKAKAGGEGGFEKLVAIKRILPHLSGDPEFVSMFMREAKLAALLSHPNIVQIYDFGRENDTYYIAMEYLWGNDLGTILKKAREKRFLPLECALYITSRIAAGLQYSHHLMDLSGNPLNIIHRDINPQNIIITHQGEVKIVDYGVAKIAEMDSTTKVGTLKGKVPYMSPEQAAGRVIDKRSDIFSTGVILYEMITGVKAFQGTTMEVLERVRNAEFRLPELVVPDLPSEICEIIHTALAKNPDQRFQTCADMFTRLDDCLTMFSERQNAENLSRHIRQLFTDESSETKSGEPLAHYLTTLHAMETLTTDRTQTLQLQVASSATPALTPPAPASSGSQPLLWISLVFLVAVISGVIFFSSYSVRVSEKGPEEATANLAARSSEQVAERSPGQSAGAVPETLQGASPLDSFQLALTAVAHEEYSKAIALFEEVLASRPELAPQAAGPYAVALLQEGVETLAKDPERARRLMAQSVEVNPLNTRGYYELGKLHTKSNEYREAIRYYNKVMELDPSLAETYFNLGFLYARVEEFSLAEDMFLKAISLDPPYIDEAYFNLAMIQKSRGKMDDSMKSLEHAVTINPGNSKATEYLGKFKKD
jgi:serine/threonine protein kinase